MSPPGTTPLDTAEEFTLMLLAAGLSNAEICEQTGLPIRVVKAHVRAAQALSGLTRRTEVAVWATRPGCD